MKMLHHPYCTKSCAALDFVNTQDLILEIVDISQNKPTREFLVDLLKKLNIPAVELIRTNESVFQRKFEGKTLSEEEWIEAIVQHPILLQRPIFIEGDRAVIGRPVEKIYELLK